MIKISRCQKLLSEIELFLEAGKFEDARVLLTFLDDEALDRESRLRLLWIDAALDGSAVYRDEIAEFSNSPDLSDLEKELIEKISLVARESVDEKTPHEEVPGDPGNLPIDQGNAERALKSELSAQAKLLQDRDAALLALKETVASQDRRLSEIKELLASRGADLQMAGVQVAELSAQLTELKRAKEHEGRALNEELARRADLLQFKESAIIDVRDRMAGQIGILETRLGETTDRLSARDAELDTFKARVDALIRERAEQISEREQARLLQDMESSIAVMEQQMGEQIRLLEVQLGEKQVLLQSSRAELDRLRSQVSVLNRPAAEAVAARCQAESLLEKERRQATQPAVVAKSIDDNPAGDRAEGLAPTVMVSSAGISSSFPWQKLAGIIATLTRHAKTFPPAVAAGLVAFPIAYFLLGQARMGNHPNAPVRWEGTFEPHDAAEQARLSILVSETLAGDEDRGKPGKSAERVVDQKAQKAAAANNRSASQGVGRPEPAAGYVTRRAVPLRERPRYAAKAKAEIGPGTSVTVLETQGSWLRVKTRQSGAVGYVRKEYLVHAVFPW